MDIDPRDHSFSTCVTFSETFYITFLPPDTHTYVSVSGVKNIRFSENFKYILNE